MGKGFAGAYRGGKDGGKERGRKRVKPIAPPSEFYCKVCEKECKTAERLAEHISAMHQYCDHPGCDFHAPERVLMFHKMRHATASDGAPLLDSGEELDVYLSARRKLFPTRAHIAEKAERRAAARESGALPMEDQVPPGKIETMIRKIARTLDFADGKKGFPKGMMMTFTKGKGKKGMKGMKVTKGMWAMWGDSDDESSYASSEAADDSGALLALPAPRDVPGDAPLPQAAEGETQAGGSGALPAADAKTTDIPGAIATGSVGMCHFFQKNGWCGYGKACRWRHSDPNK